MKRTTAADRVIQWILAGLCVVPLLAALGGPGSFSDVFGLQAGESAEAAAIRHGMYWTAFGHSLLLAGGATGLAVLIGVPAGWALSRRRHGLLWLAACALPLALAPNVAVSGWLHWTAPAGVRSAFVPLSPDLVGPGPMFSVPGAALILGGCLWPIVAFETWPAFRRARGEAYAAALLSGSPRRAFFRIALPMVQGELAAGAFLVLLLAASDFTVSSLLLVRTLPVEVHDHLAFGHTARAAWAATPLIAFAFLLGAGKLLLRRWTGQGAPESGADAQPVQAGARGADLPLWLGLAVGFALPMTGCLFGLIGSDGSVAQAFREGLPALGISLRLATAAAIFAMLLGALRVVVWPESSAAPLRMAGLLALAVPGSLLAGGMIALQLMAQYWGDWLGLGAEGMGWLLPGSVVLGAGYLIRFLYVPMRLAEEGLRGLDPALLESAQLSGHGRWSRGLNIALPLVWSHLLAAAALVFVLALGELPVSQKLAPPGGIPLSVTLFNLQHYDYNASVFALSLLGGGAVAGVLLAAGWWIRRIQTPRPPASAFSLSSST